jgi:hypothetical protein
MNACVAGNDAARGGFLGGNASMNRRLFVAGLATIPLALLSLRAIGDARAEADARLSFAEMYEPRSVRGIDLAAGTRALAGKRVQILGYMAPPLKPEVRFFVLTRSPVALCPFCNSDADWPSDIVVVYPREREGWSQDGLPVAVSGTFEVGAKVDAKTGFVSLVRIVDATVKTLR